MLKRLKSEGFIYIPVSSSDIETIPKELFKTHDVKKQQYLLSIKKKPCNFFLGRNVTSYF
jgi:hypothetical protein